MGVAELVTPASQSERPALETAIASRRLPPLQFLKRTEDSNAENRRTGALQNLKQIIAPGRILKKVIDDQVCAKGEMRAPAPVNTQKQPLTVRVEHQTQAWAPPMLPHGAALIDIFPTGPAVKRSRDTSRETSPPLSFT